jgi:hypothetical protein
VHTRSRCVALANALVSALNEVLSEEDVTALLSLYNADGSFSNLFVLGSDPPIANFGRHLGRTGAHARYSLAGVVTLLLSLHHCCPGWLWGNARQGTQRAKGISAIGQ